MDKNKMLIALDDARNSHISQMNIIKKMINTNTLTDDLILDKDKCGFGSWLYDDRYNLKYILGSLFFTKLEEEYIRWHTESSKIYKILSQKEENKSIFGLVGFGKKDIMKFEKAAIYFEQLKTKSGDLLKALESCERRLSALSKSIFH